MMKETMITTSKIKGEEEKDPFLSCTCGPCKRFWRESFGGKTGATLIQKPIIERTTDTSTLYKQYHEDNLLKIGDRVLVWGTHTGVVKFMGLLDEHLIAPETYIGVHLDQHIGSTHNGVYKSKRYFHCPRGHGAFVRYGDCRPILPFDPTPPLTGNFMFPSWDEVKKRRKERALREKFSDLAYQPSLAMSPPPMTRGAGATTSALLPKRGAGKRVIFDPNDMIVRDAQRKEMEERRRRMLLAQQRRMSPRERRMLKWKEEFGGDDRANYMIKTLEKLHLAYEHGKDALEQEKAEAERSDDEDDDYDDDDDEKSGY